MRRSSLSAAVQLFALAAVAAAEAQEASASPERPRLALALSGGGARGIAHVGALRALEEAGLPVDAIAANSMGAVVGSIYATGRSAAELEAIVRSLDWAGLFSGRPDRRTLPVARRDEPLSELIGVSFDRSGVRLPAGLVAEHRVNRFLIEHLAPANYAAERDFDRLAIPFRAVATDLKSGDQVILAHGDLARAVRASMSIPVVFPPIEWEGRRLVDGLLVDNLPTDVAKGFGAAVTVAIDIASPDLEPGEYADSIGIATQVSNLLAARRNQDHRADADVYIRPDLGKHSAMEYAHFAELIEAGYQATKQAIPAIREKLAAALVTSVAPRPRPVPARVLEGSPIAEVTTRGNQRASESLLRRTFNIPIGPPFEMARGLRAFDKIEATGLVEHCFMDFEPAPGGLRIVLHARDAPPNRAGIGLAYSEWEKARASVRLRNQNTLGFGEQTELLLAASTAFTLGELSLRGDRLFVAGLGYRVAGYLITDKPRFFDAEGAELNRGKFERQGVSVGLQTALERWGLVEAGARFGRVKTVPQPAVPVPEASDTVATLFAGFTVDTLDELLWPQAGGRLAAAAEWNLDSMGATHPYWRLRVEGRFGRAIGHRAVVQVDGLLGLSGEDLPVYDHFRVGGPALVPGYHFEELKGPQTFAGGLSLRYRVWGRLSLLARTGAGNVFANTGDVGFDDLRWGVAGGIYYPSRIGPISIEAGVRDDGGTLWSLVVGWH